VPYNRPRLEPRRRPAAVTRTTPSKGRPARQPEFEDALESVSRGIRDPAAKLRFLRQSISRYETLDHVVQGVPFAPVRRRLYRWLGLERLRHLLHTESLGAPRPVDGRTRRAVVLHRLGTTAASLVALGVLGGLAVGTYRLFVVGSSRPVSASAAGAEAPAPAALPPALPAVAGLAPAAVWMVEQGKDFEQYSNGLRIETGLTVAGEPRRYRTFAESGQLLPEVQDRPVGILFHTSESDVWPLEAAFNENLRDSSQRLLRYVARHRLYHYLIDRFGRVYRMVGEEAKANHAGHSVWTGGNRLYLNLNHAFLGVSFETRWEGGRALPITQAQFAAGRNLTDYLRQRWSIAPEMCVAHGLTSVNPKKRLIGHHLDWARGFPFEAFGLPDQYRRPAPSVTIFGFGYDDELLAVMGAPWPGAQEAERALADEAVRLGMTLTQLRLERQARYEPMFLEQSREEAAPADSRAEPPRRTGQETGG
jgi:hypothetical protein